MKLIFLIFILFAMMPTEEVAAQQKSIPVLQWEVAGELPDDSLGNTAKGIAGPVAGISHNVLLLAGGANFPEAFPWNGGAKKYYSEGYIYARLKNNLKLISTRFQLPHAIAYPAVCTTGQGVFYAGGENENGFSNKAWLMFWNPEQNIVEFKALPDLPVAMSNAAATNIENKIYVAGGETSAAALANFIYLDLKNVGAGWQTLPNVPQLVSHSILSVVCSNNHHQLLLSGGRKKNTNGISEFYKDVYMFDIKNNTWTAKASLPYALAAGTGAAYKKNKVLLFGGDKGLVYHETELLIVAISKETDETKKQELINKKNKLQENHPGFSGEVWLYNSKKDQWQAISKIPFAAPVTTTAIKWENDFIIPSGEIKAGVRSPHLLMLKILKP